MYLFIYVYIHEYVSRCIYLYTRAPDRHEGGGGGAHLIGADIFIYLYIYSFVHTHMYYIYICIWMYTYIYGCVSIYIPEPQTDTKVVEAVHMRFAQIETVTKRCRHAYENGNNRENNSEKIANKKENNSLTDQNGSVVEYKISRKENSCIFGVNPRLAQIETVTKRCRHACSNKMEK